MNAEEVARVLDALYDQHMKDAGAHRDIARRAKDGANAEKADLHMRTALMFRNKAHGVADAMHAIAAWEGES